MVGRKAPAQTSKEPFMGVWNRDGDTPLNDISGAITVADLADHPGEDTSFDRTWGGGLWKKQVCTQAAGDVLIGSAGPIVFGGYEITVATSAHTPLFRDGTSDSGTAFSAIPVSQPIGTSRNYGGGIYCANGLWLDWNSASTGTITVLYQQL